MTDIPDNADSWPGWRLKAGVMREIVGRVCPFVRLVSVLGVVSSERIEK
jgi:hypothetical protein